MTLPLLPLAWATPPVPSAGTTGRSDWTVVPVSAAAPAGATQTYDLETPRPVQLDVDNPDFVTPHSATSIVDIEQRLDDSAHVTAPAQEVLTIAKDLFDCPICLQTYVEPMVLGTCGH